MYRAVYSGGSKGGTPGMHSPMDQNFFNFMQYFGKIWQICMLAPPPEGLAPPPTRNPESAPGLEYLLFLIKETNQDFENALAKICHR